MKLFTRIFLGLGLLVFAVEGASAQGVTRICTELTGANGSNNCTDVSATNPFPISGSFSATTAGFNLAVTGTPFTATTGGATSSSFTSSVEVVVSNVGTTNAAYCAPGASATTSSQYIGPGSWFAFYAAGGITQVSCITGTSTTTINLSAGAGLPTGAGGGGGGGGGTVAQGTAASSGPWIETPWIAGAVNSATNGLYFNLLQGNAVVASGNPIPVISPLTGTVTNPTSTLSLTSATTAYAIGNLIASSATAGSVVVPSFAIANSAGGAVINKMILTTNDSTSTAWGSAQVQVDLWTAAPTFTNGDRGAFAPATGTAGHRAAFTCIFSPEYGDGAYAECTPNSGSETVKLASGTSIFWTLQALTVSGVTGASKVFTLTAEVLN